MKVITINVNGIRAAQKKGLFKYFKKQSADIICLQEIKAQESQLDERFYPDNYYTYYNSAIRKGYSGTAILTKLKPDNVIRTTPWQMINDEGRLTQVSFSDLSIVSIYLPSGSAKQERQDLKMQFLQRQFMPYLKKIQQNKKKYIICGDWNIAHKKIDIKNWRNNQNNSGFLKEERDFMDELFYKANFIDSFREINKESGHYTWWSNRGRSWQNNTGWRIDYQVISANLRNSVKNASIYKDERFSDHSPLIVEYNL